MMNMPTLKQVKNPEFDKPLIEMEQLLRRVHATCYADNLLRIIDLLHANPCEAMEYLTSGNFWGGAGSYFDLQFYQGRHRSSDFDEDNREYQRLLLNTLENLYSEGCKVRGFNKIKRYLLLTSK